MPLETFLALIVMAAVTYRIARFLILDDLIVEARERFNDALAERPNRLTVKLQILMLCPFCLTIWIAIGVTLPWFLVIDDWPGWRYPYYALAVAAWSLIQWEYIDSKKDEK